MTFSQFLCRDVVNSQFLSSLLNSSLSLSLPVLPVAEIAPFEILDIRNGHPPILIAEPKFTNVIVKRFHFLFLVPEFRSRVSKQVISVPIKRRFRNICRDRESEEKFTATRNLLMS